MQLAGELPRRPSGHLARAAVCSLRPPTGLQRLGPAHQQPAANQQQSNTEQTLIETSSWPFTSQFPSTFHFFLSQISTKKTLSLVALSLNEPPQHRHKCLSAGQFRPNFSPILPNHKPKKGRNSHSHSLAGSKKQVQSGQ